MNKKKLISMNDQKTKANPKMITLARESRGLLQNELSDKLSATQGYISKVEMGASTLNDETLDAISKALNFPETFFYQDAEVLPANLSYRKRDKVAQKLITPIDAQINIYRINLQILLSALKIDKVEIPNLDLSEFGTPENAAKELRNIWNIPQGPIINLAEYIEKNGIALINFDFKTERVDGRSICTDNGTPIIITNKTLLGDRQRFTLAYELGHLVMHMNNVPEYSRDIGHEANKFAAEFLMPENDIKDDLVDLSLAKLAELKKKWKVSMQSLLYRANDLALITDNQKRYFLQQFNQQNIRRREPKELDLAVENYKLVRDMITHYRTKQKISVSKMASFLHLEQDDFLDRYDFN